MWVSVPRRRHFCDGICRARSFCSLYFQLFLASSSQVSRLSLCLLFKDGEQFRFDCIPWFFCSFFGRHLHNIFYLKGINPAIILSSFISCLCLPFLAHITYFYRRYFCCKTILWRKGKDIFVISYLTSLDKSYTRSADPSYRGNFHTLSNYQALHIVSSIN